MQTLFSAFESLLYGDRRRSAMRSEADRVRQLAFREAVEQHNLLNALDAPFNGSSPLLMEWLAKRKDH